VTKKQSNGIKR